jgi:hypothetical protein
MSFVPPLRHLIEITDLEQAKIISSCIKPSLDIIHTPVNIKLPYFLPAVLSKFSEEEKVTAHKILPGVIEYMCVIIVCAEYQYLVPFGLSVEDSIASFSSRLDKNTDLVIEAIISSLNINVPLGLDNIYNKEVYTRHLLQAILEDQLSTTPISELDLGLSLFQIGPLVNNSVDSVMDDFNTVITPHLSQNEIIPYFLKYMPTYFLPKAKKYFLTWASDFLNYPEIPFDYKFPPTNDPLLQKFLDTPQTVLSTGEQIATDILEPIFRKYYPHLKNGRFVKP